MKTELPILFKGSMVRAILDGRKTQTRRVVKPQPVNRPIRATQEAVGERCEWYDADCINPGKLMKCPYGVPGGKLWVKETFGLWCHSFESVGVEYAAGGPDEIVTFRDQDGMPSLETQCQKNIGGGRRKRPSIFMPRWASRITLEVVSIEVERLQWMSNEDAQAEGIIVSMDDHSVNLFADLWDSINGKTYPWASNPWVWRVEFKRVKENS